MKKKNAGFTLPELIVIMTIMVTVLGYLAWNSSVIFGYGARECQKKLASSISSLKVDTLSKSKKFGDCWLEVSTDSKGAVYVEEFINSKSQGKTQIAKRKVKIIYREADGTKVFDSRKRFAFDRADGSMLEANGYSGGSEPMVYSIPRQNETISKIEIGGGRHTYTIEISPITGKISYRVV